MKNLIEKLSLIFIILAISACNATKIPPQPIIKLEVQPLESIYINYDAQSDSFRIGNEFIERTLIVDKKANRIFTKIFLNKLTQQNYINTLGDEFSLNINGTQISGVTGNIKYNSYHIYSTIDAKGLELSFNVELEKIGKINLRLLYEVYSHIPAIRKWIEVENPMGSAIIIENILTESLSLMPGADFDIEIDDLAKYLKNSKIKGLSPVIYNTNLKEGFIIGNEAPGILKDYNLYPKPGKIAVGMTFHGNQYLPKIQLMPNEVFTSPAVFIFLFKGEPEQSKETLSEFLSSYVLLNQHPKYSVYFENISSETTESNLIEKVKQAKDSGVDVFCISGNWTDKRGDWTYDKNAYIKNVCEYAHSLGMKFGLCIDLAIAEPESIILNQHPQWVVKKKNGSDYEISDSKAKLMCLASEYALYMAYEIDAIVKELNLDYVKLTGNMLPLDDDGGCFAKDHLHNINEESLWNIYNALFDIIKYLHSQKWDLIVDVALESYNPSGFLDYELLKYADINWEF